MGAYIPLRNREKLQKRRQDTIVENLLVGIYKAFDRLCGILPDSVVTIYVGRHAIELGFKYLLLKKAGKIETTHDLGELAELVFEEYDIKDNYMNYVDHFVKCFVSMLKEEMLNIFDSLNIRNKLILRVIVWI